MRHVHPHGHPLRLAETHLRAADPLFDSIIPHYGECRLLERHGQHFHVLTKTVIDQQLAVKAAAKIAGRLLHAHGGDEFSADGLLAMPPEAMRGAGLSGSKADTLRGLATAIRHGTLRLADFEDLDDATVRKELCAFRGIGPWTAEIFLMFGLGRLDVLPLGDLGLRNAIKRYYRLADTAKPDAYQAIAERWRPYRSVATWYLWAAVD